MLTDLSVRIGVSAVSAVMYRNCIDTIAGTHRPPSLAVLYSRGGRSEAQHNIYIYIYIKRERERERKRDRDRDRDTLYR